MNFLGFIKNGNKGTYGLQMPAFYPASRVTYGGGTVEDALDESIRVSCGSSTYGTITALQYAKIGSIVTMVGTFTATSNIPAHTQFISDIPAMGVSNYVPIIAWDNTSYNTVTWLLAMNGTIQNEDAIISGHNYRFSITYLV